MPYIPTRDADLITWGSNFASLLTADPMLYGLLASDASVIQSNYDEFAAAYTASQDPSTRTIVTVAAKDEEKAGFLSLARAYAAIIRANGGVTPENKAALGLTIPDPTPTPIPVPGTYPVGNIPFVGVNTHPMTLADQLSPLSKAKPFGVAGALVYRAVGAVAPTDFDDSRAFLIATRADTLVSTAGLTQGQFASYWARWFNRKGEFGPLSAPFSAVIM